MIKKSTSPAAKPPPPPPPPPPPRDSSSLLATSKEPKTQSLLQRGQPAARLSQAASPSALAPSRDVSSFTSAVKAQPRSSAAQRLSLDGGAGLAPPPLLPKDTETLRVNPSIGLPLPVRASTPSAASQGAQPASGASAPTAGAAPDTHAARAPEAAARAEELNDQVENAEDYDDLRQAAEEIAQEFESNPDPAYQQELAETLGPALRRLGELSSLTDPETGEGTAIPEALARATAAVSPEVASTLAEDFVEGNGDQPLSGPFLRVLESTEAGPLAEALQGAFQEAGNTRAVEDITAARERGGYLSEASGQVQGAQRALDDAQAEVAALEEQLSAELAAAGPALTDEQRQAYVERFRSDNATAYERVDEAAAELAEALRNPELAQAVQDSPAVAESVLQGYQSLASTSEAAAVVEWGGQVFADPESPLYQALAAADPGFAERFGNEVLPTAVENAASGLLANADFNPAQAADQLTELLTPLRNARGLANSALALSTADWDSFLGGLRGAAQGNTDPLQSLLNKWNAEGGVGGARQALAVTGLLFGIAGAGSAAANGDLAAFAGSVASALPNGAQLLSYALGRLGNAAQAASLAGGAAATAAAGALARSVPVLSVIDSSIASIRDIGELAQDPSWGRAVSALGTFASAAGSVISLIGATGPVGGVVAAVGGVISVVGGILEAREVRQETQRNIRERLEAIGFDEDLAETLSQASPVATRQLEEYGLTAQDIQRAAEDSPALLTSSSAARSSTELGQAYGLDPSQLLSLAEAAHESGVNMNQLTGRVITKAIERVNGQISTPEQRERYHEEIRELLERHYPELAALAQQLSEEASG